MVISREFPSAGLMRYLQKELLKGAYRNHINAYITLEQWLMWILHLTEGDWGVVFRELLPPKCPLGTARQDIQ